MSLTHLKLNKFVGGDLKRLFQSDIHHINFEKDKTLEKAIFHDTKNKVEDKLNNTTFYGKFSSLLKSTYLLVNSSYINNLLAFNEILPKYISEKLKANIKNSTTTNRYYLNLFEKYSNVLNQDIYYFKANLDSPIDIIGVLNVAYLLSPLKNNKNVQLSQQDSMLQLRNYNIYADYKENYKDMYLYVLNKDNQYPLNNNIPLYDMNFSNLETITFNTLSGLQNWLIKYKLDKLYYNTYVVSSYITANINNKFNNLNDSINLTNLIEVLTKKLYSIYFTLSIKKLLFKLLIDNILESSINCYLSKIADISKLANKTQAMILSSNLISSSFNLSEQLIYENLRYDYKDDLFLNNIPNNTLYIMETVNPLNYGNDNQKPSAYINFVNLKNNQSPLEDFEVQIPTSFIDSKSFDNNNYVLNKNIVKLFNNDKTKSLEFNADPKYNTIKSTINNEINYIPTKDVTSAILDVALEYDNLIASSLTYATLYNYMNNQRLTTKKEHYLMPFYLRHIENNKLYLLGLLCGIRSYLHGGILDNLQNIWLSYKYITSRSQELLDSYSLYYNFPFYTYLLSRDTNMLKDYIGTLYKGIENARITKEAYQLCPFNKKGVNLAKSCFKCTAKTLEQCKGYCTFPYNNEYLIKKNGNVIPASCYWNYKTYSSQIESFNNTFNGFNLYNSLWFYFPCGNNVKTLLYTFSLLIVSDDIEIYFSNLDIKLFTDYINKYGPFYNSIYRGFGGAVNNLNYLEYLLRNNILVSKLFIYEEISIALSFKTILEYRKLYIKATLDACLSTLFNRELSCFINNRYMNRVNIFSNALKKILGMTLYNIIELDENKQAGYNGFNELTFKKIISNYSFITLVKKFSNLYYYNLYYNNLYMYIKDLTVDNIAIKDLSISKINAGTQYMYNGFAITLHSPFNGPHKIEKDARLYGILIKKDNNNITVSNEPVYEIKPNMNCYIRVVNWWSNLIKLQGKIGLKIIENELLLADKNKYSKILETLNNFDYVLKVLGFFKSNQANYKKSNIYSIKVTNSGFNPLNDISFTSLYDYILIKNYAYLSKLQKTFYLFMPTLLFLYLELKKIKNILYDDNTICKIIYLANLNSNANLLAIVKDISIYYLNDRNNNMFTENSFKKSNMYAYISNQGGLYKLNKDILSKAITAKKLLRQIFLNAIKNSVKKYMPIHTDLWKIVYSGK